MSTLPRQCPDWIQSYVDYSDVTETPIIMREWSAIAALVACTHVSKIGLYPIKKPGFVVLLCASPAQRRSSSLRIINHLVEKSGHPVAWTAKRTNSNNTFHVVHEVAEWNQMSIVDRVSDGSLFMLGSTTHMGWDNLIPALKSRCVRVRSLEWPKHQLIYVPPDKAQEERLVADLKHIRHLEGDFELTGEARDLVMHIYEVKDDSIAFRHLLHVASAVNIARTDDLLITVSDVQRAVDYLSKAEKGQ